MPSCSGVVAFGGTHPGTFRRVRRAKGFLLECAVRFMASKKRRLETRPNRFLCDTVGPIPPGSPIPPPLCFPFRKGIRLRSIGMRGRVRSEWNPKPSPSWWPWPTWRRWWHVFSDAFARRRRCTWRDSKQDVDGRTRPRLPRSVGGEAAWLLRGPKGGGMAGGACLVHETTCTAGPWMPRGSMCFQGCCTRAPSVARLEEPFVRASLVVRERVGLRVRVSPPRRTGVFDPFVRVTNGPTDPRPPRKRGNAPVREERREERVGHRVHPHCFSLTFTCRFGRRVSHVRPPRPSTRSTRSTLSPPRFASDRTPRLSLIHI